MLKDRIVTSNSKIAAECVNVKKERKKERKKEQFAD
jgi:hypothetical protein